MEKETTTEQLAKELFPHPDEIKKELNRIVRQKKKRPVENSSKKKVSGV